MREGGDKCGAHWGLRYKRHLSGHLSVRMAEDALLF